MGGKLEDGWSGLHPGKTVVRRPKRSFGDRLRRFPRSIRLAFKGYWAFIKGLESLSRMIFKPLGDER
jgi:hypothetical protein